MEDGAVRHLIVESVVEYKVIGMFKVERKDRGFGQQLSSCYR